uniref:SEFIR domain-containing protein n=1 Tax=Parastrongyloides trichosuri TaxID=131310 RepID=A0A0N4Z198_PARTI
MFKLFFLLFFVSYVKGDVISCSPNCIAIVADSLNQRFFKVNSSNVFELAADFIIRTNSLNGDEMSEVTIHLTSTLPNIPIFVYNDRFEGVNFTIIAQTQEKSLNDIKIKVKQLFEFGQNYTIVIGYKKIKLNMIDDYDKISNNCTPTDIVFGSAHYASLWKSHFDNINVDNNKRIINVSFSGAPLQYCFEEYEIELENINTTKIETKFFSNKHLLEKDGYHYGNVIFKHLISNNIYVARVKPNKHRVNDKICLCIQRDWNCGCMIEESEEIYLGNQNTEEKNELINDIFYSHIFMFTVIFLFFILSLVISCILLSRIIKTFFKSQILTSTPLLSHSSDNSWIYQNTRSLNDKTEKQTILIIHNNNKKAEYLGYELIQFNCNVLLDCWESKKINKNKNLWISNSLKDADKILLIPEENDEIISSMYKTFISCIKITDPRVIIVAFQNNSVNEMSLCTEKLYILPRDKELLLVNALLLKKRKSSLDSSICQDFFFDDNFIEYDNKGRSSKTISLSSYTENFNELLHTSMLGDASLDRVIEICEETV